MFKVTPNPPDTDPVSPYEPDSNKLNEAAERALDFHFPSNADIKATARTPSKLFSVDQEASNETLVVFLVETLASVDVMVHQLVDHLEGEARMRCWGFQTASWWRRSRRTGCWIRLIHLSSCCLLWRVSNRVGAVQRCLFWGRCGVPTSSLAIGFSVFVATGW